MAEHVYRTLAEIPMSTPLAASVPLGFGGTNMDDDEPQEPSTEYLKQMLEESLKPTPLAPSKKKKTETAEPKKKPSAETTDPKKKRKDPSPPVTSKEVKRPKKPSVPSAPKEAVPSTKEVPSGQPTKDTASSAAFWKDVDVATVRSYARLIPTILAKAPETKPTMLSELTWLSQRLKPSTVLQKYGRAHLEALLDLVSKNPLPVETEDEIFQRL